MKIKEGVNLNQEIEVEMTPVIYVVERVWSRHGLQSTLTDYWRPGSGGMHAVGLAMDFRTYDVATKLREQLAFETSVALGPGYQVILEDGRQRWYYRAGKLTAFGDAEVSRPKHMHVEFDI